MLLPYLQTELLEAGCDEAGRGCLAGPVYAAAVILPKNFSNALLNDSKQLSESNRYVLREIIEQEALAFAIAKVSHTEIDKINILKASIKAMHLAIQKLQQAPELLLIDGNRFIKYKNTPHQCIVKGDSIYSSIAAASILAKTYRDDEMLKLHKKFPQYNWASNKGYGTAEHRAAMEKHGRCTLHRKSFVLKSEVNNLELW
jgi:ribonuclease HII